MAGGAARQAEMLASLRNLPNQQTPSNNGSGSNAITTTNTPDDRTQDRRSMLPASSVRSSSSSSSSSSSESEPASRLTKSMAFLRHRRFASSKAPKHPFQASGAATHDDDEDDEDESPAFLPFSTEAAPQAPPDPSATLRLPTSIPSPPPKPTSSPDPPRPRSQMTHSSASSAGSSPAAAGAPTDPGRGRNQPAAPRIPGPLSPRRAAELAAVSPRRRAGLGRDGSDGTPSMGSSFSDLDGEMPLFPLLKFVNSTAQSMWEARLSGSLLPSFPFRSRQRIAEKPPG